VSTVAHTSATLTAQGVTKRFGARAALLSILAGVSAPSSGSVSSAPAGGRIGWVPQQPAVYSKLSVAENLRLFARLEKLVDVDAVVARMLDQTGLVERADDEVGKLSGGNQQRVNIAIGLLCEPVALLLDEPSSSLDPRQREVLWEFIGGLAGRGTTVVYSTHNVAEAERYADRVLVLVDGSLVFAGSAAELERTVAAADVRDFEAAFVRFLALRGAG
jgi:ABC-2 type transport system ATP-binding protein